MTDRPADEVRLEELRKDYAVLEAKAFATARELLRQKERAEKAESERDAANARAEELRHALDNCRRVAGRKTKELPIPLSAMNNTESAIADIACELAGNLLSISEWANRALGGASAYAPRAQARKL